MGDQERSGNDNEVNAEAKINRSTAVMALQLVLVLLDGAAAAVRTALEALGAKV
jgi:molybdopterin biosynthesis enzyme MoaB